MKQHITSTSCPCLLAALIIIMCGNHRAVEAISNNNNHNNKCALSCNMPKSVPNLFNDHNGPVPTVIPICNIKTVFGKSECFIEMEDILYLANATSTQVFYSQLICDANVTNVIKFVNRMELYRPDYITYLWIKNCNTTWEDIHTFSLSVNLKVFFAENKLPWWENENRTIEKWSLMSNESINNISVIPNGLREIGTLGLYNNLPTQTLPNIFTKFVWPNMAEIEIHQTTTENASSCNFFSIITLDDLSMTLPYLQSIELFSGCLSKPPLLFPWMNNETKLPLNLSRSIVGNQHYAASHSLDLFPHVYRRVLFLNNNNITDLRDYIFHGYLMKISLKFNRLKYIGNNTFSELQGLQSLDLSNNHLMELPLGVFRNLENLVLLTLNHNFIKGLPGGIFSHLSLIQRIDLGYNKLKIIESDIFIDLPELSAVQINFNEIEKISPNVFAQDQNKLTEISLAHNYISEIPNCIFLLRNAKQIDLSSNLITFETMIRNWNNIDARHMLFQNRDSASSFSATVKPVTHYKYINLKNNYISTINLRNLTDQTWRLFSQILYFYILDIVDNGFVCDCNSLEFYQYLHGEEHIQGTPVTTNKLQKNNYYTDHLPCDFPIELRDMQLYSMEKLDFKCAEDMENCPEKCSCYRRTVDNAILIDCSNRNMTELPNKIPESTKELNLSGNAIQYINTAPEYVKYLNVLSLDHNVISDVSAEFVDVVCHREKMYKLNLNDNKLRWLPSNMQTCQIKKELRLSGNPWSCDCHVTWLKQFLIIERSIVKDLDDIMCVTGKSAGKVLVEAPLNDFICVTPPEIILRNAFTCLGIFLLLLFVAICVAYKYRGEIKILMYVYFNCHPFDTTEETDILNVNFDAFISYSGLDYKWICFELLKKLEQRDPPYRACLHDRNFMPGSYIEDNIMEAVQTSRRMILVLTNNYLQSDWCMLEFRAAHNKVLNERTNYLILVVYDDVDLDSLDEDLKLYIRTNTYLSVSNKWFYEKLFYAMPQKPIAMLHEELKNKCKKEQNTCTKLVVHSHDSSEKSPYSSEDTQYTSVTDLSWAM